MRHIPQPAVDTVQKIKPHPEAASLVHSVGLLCRQPFSYTNCTYTWLAWLERIERFFNCPRSSQAKASSRSSSFLRDTVQNPCKSNQRSNSCNSELLNFKGKFHSMWHTQMSTSKTRNYVNVAPLTSDILILWVPKIWNHEGAPVLPLLKVCHFQHFEAPSESFYFCLQRLGAKFPDFDWSATKQGINRFHHLLDRLKVWHGPWHVDRLWAFLGEQALQVLETLV